jgi:type IV pilus assembly protein PilP
MITPGKVFIIFIITNFLVCTYHRVGLCVGNSTKQKESIPDWIFPRPFKYNAKQLPDPFIPFVKARLPKKIINKKNSKAPLLPLQKIDPSQLKLVGIIFSSEKNISPMALVELPDKKGYILKIGTLVGPNGGVVTSINSKSVIIKEFTEDIFGEKKYRETILKLHTREGD